MNKQSLLYNEIRDSLLDKNFLKAVVVSKKNMMAEVDGEKWKLLSERIYEIREENGRFNSLRVFEIIESSMNDFTEKPRCGWMQHCYN